VTAGGVYGRDEGLQAWLEARELSYVLRASSSSEPLKGAETVLPRLSEWAQTDAGGRASPAHKWGYAPLRRVPSTGLIVGWLGLYSESPAEEYAYYRTHAPRGTALSKLARVAVTSSVIEDGVERAKGEVGLDQYEVRRWDAWHRHVTLCLIAHASMQVAQSVVAGQNVAADLPQG
jgi:hypothetical protein